MLILAGYTGSNVNSSKFVQVTYSTGMQTNSSDIWINLSLLTWQADSEVDWDADGTDFDPQFRICFDVDGETDGISEVCEFTQIWQDSSFLSSSLNLSFDIPEEFSTVLFTIECYDNDDESDEWNDGPDACDLNELDNAWKLLIEINSTSAGTYEFNGSGYGDSNSQGSKGDGNISFMAEVVHYEDSDGDGIADKFDDCNQTPSGRQVSTDGCWWMEGDIDDDGILNPVDHCNGLIGDCKISGQYIIQGDTRRGVSWFDIDGEIITLSRGENNVFRALNETGHETNVRTSGYGVWKFGESVSQQTIGFSPDSNYFFMFQNTGSQHNPCSLNLNRINSTGFSESLYVASYGSQCSIALFAQEKLYVWFGSGEIGYYNHVDLLDYVSGITAIVPSFNLVHTLEDATGQGMYLSGINPSQNLILFRYTTSTNVHSSMMLDVSDDTVSSLQFDIQNWEDRTGFLSDRHFIDGELIYDLISGSSSTLETSNTAYHPGDYPILTISEGSGVYSLVNPSTNIESKIIDCYEHCNDLGSIAVSPDGSRILVGSDWYETEYEGVPFFVGYADYDFDGIPYTIDICENTTQGMSVNAVGCAENQKDDDSDGVLNSIDNCPGTVSNLLVDESGCAQYQLDDDFDGVANDLDVCPNSPSGKTVDLSGCSSSQVDTDGDGIYDSQDNCPSTPPETTVDSTGCAPDDVVDLDSDEDGIRDSIDTCPDSASGIVVDSSGCETSGDVKDESTNLESDDSGMMFESLCILSLVICIGFYILYNRSLEFGDDNSDDLSYDSDWYAEPENSDFSDILGYLEQQSSESERELSNLRQQLAEESTASEVAQMQKEMQALKQRVIESEQAKLELKQEIEEVRIQTDESINIRDSAIDGDVVSSGGQKIESQTNIAGIDSDTLEKILDRERQTAKEIARMEEELARLRGERR